MPTSLVARHGGPFSKVPASGKNLLNNNNNNNNNTSSGEGGGSLHHPYLFPLTSDLRESLSRYLNQDNNKAMEDERNTSSTEIMDTATTHEDQEDEEDEQPPQIPKNNRLHQQLTQKSQSSSKTGGGAALALEGLIGNRLSNLFQLNDILLRSGGGPSSGTREGGENRPESLLDLTKK